MNKTLVFSQSNGNAYLEVELALLGLLLDGGQLALGLVPGHARQLSVLNHRRLSYRHTASRQAIEIRYEHIGSDEAQL